MAVPVGLKVILCEELLVWAVRIFTVDSVAPTPCVKDVDRAVQVLDEMETIAPQAIGSIVHLDSRIET